MKNKYITAFFFVFLKAGGALFFSLVIVYIFDENVHANLMHDISLTIGLTIFTRIGAEQVILKYGGYLYELNKINYFKYLNSFFVITSLLLSIAVGGLTLSIYGLKVVNELLFIPWLFFNSVMSLYVSNLKVIKKAQYSAIFESGFILLFSSLAVLIFTVELTVKIVIPIMTLAFGLWALVYLRPTVVNPFKFPWRSDSDVDQEKVDFIKSLPIFTLSTFFNFFTQWGVIFICSMFFSNTFVSEFTIILRVCAIFNLMMVLISSFSVSKIYYIFQTKGQAKLQSFTNEHKKKYVLSSLILTTLLLLSYILANYFLPPAYFNYSMVLFLILVFASAFNLATGPASQYIAMLGKEAQVMKIRFVYALGLIIISMICDEFYFGILFGSYLILQKIHLVIYLRKKLNIRII
jgi:hypothetical protein